MMSEGGAPSAGGALIASVVGKAKLATTATSAATSAVLNVNDALRLVPGLEVTRTGPDVVHDRIDAVDARRRAAVFHARLRLPRGVRIALPGPGASHLGIGGITRFRPTCWASW